MIVSGGMVGVGYFSEEPATVSKGRCYIMSVSKLWSRLRIVSVILCGVINSAYWRHVPGHSQSSVKLFTRGLFHRYCQLSLSDGSKLDSPTLKAQNECGQPQNE